MKSIRFRHAVLALSFASLPLACHAVSYREWAAEPAAAQAAFSIILEPVSNGYVQETTMADLPGTQRAKTSVEVPERSPGGYIGSVAVWQNKNLPVDYPLTVTFSFPEIISDEDLLPSPGTNISAAAGKVGKDSSLKWHQPMGLLNPAAPVREGRYRQSFRVDALSSSGRTAFPLVLPCRSHMNIFRMAGLSRLLACLCEITDARGKILARKHLIELFSPGRYGYSRGTAWVMSEADADRLLRDLAGIEKAVTLLELPPLMGPCAEIDALWVSSEAARAGKPDRGLLRRLLLMGVRVFGNSETVSNLTAAAGLPGAGSVLMGGIESLSQQSGRKEHWKPGNQRGLWETTDYIIRPEKGATNAAPVMENRRDLFQPFQRLYIGWTVGILGLFCAVAGIGLPLAFWRLKGSRRIVLWWLIPAVAVITGTAGLIIGRAILPRCAQSDVTEYRFAYAGWPDVYCHSINRLLTFEDRQAAWTLSPGSFLFPIWSYENSAASRHSMQSENNLTRRSLSGLKRGQIIIEETATFRSTPIPVELERTSGMPRLKSSAPLRKVHVWENGAWHKLGDLAPGKAYEVSGLAATNELTGIPERIKSCIPIFNYEPGPCKRCGKVHNGDKQLSEAFTNTWVVAAVSDEPAAARPEINGVETKTRTVWFIQIPVTPGDAKPNTGASRP
ncbi:MAG: hypothetical protein WC299_08945 [Kiritimatiellia bacterium]